MEEYGLYLGGELYCGCIGLPRNIPAHDSVGVSCSCESLISVVGG